MPERTCQNIPADFYEIKHVKVEGTANFAPYVDVSVAALTKRLPGELKFKARIDTGADITCVPKAIAESLEPLLLGKKRYLRMANGKISRIRTRLLIVHIIDIEESFRPSDGVMLTSAEIGHIGMDILARLELRMACGRMYLRRKGGGE